MARATKTKTKKVTLARAHFAIRAIRNRNPQNFRAHRAGSVLARIFSF